MNIIRQYRIEKGLTLRDVARMTNISASMLSEMERGKRKLIRDNVARRDLAYILGLPLSELEGGMSNEELYQQARNAIEELFSDTSVGVQKCVENMQGLQDQIEEYVESLESAIWEKVKD